MELRPGYKQTEVGVIPEDWEVKPLGNLGEALIGLTYKPTDVRSDGTLVLRSSNIQNDALAFEDNVFVDTHIPDRIKVQPGDVLICVRNGSRDLIGKSVLLDERTNGMTFGAFMAVFRSPIGKLVSYMFQAELLKRQINEQLGATINQITNKSLNSFQIPVPPTKAEQRAIATALGDVDALLESLERLIAKQRDLKQAAMQQLLTGQTRLPGFSGEWEVKTIEEVADCLDNLRIPLNEMQRNQMRGDIPYCGANGVLDYVNDYVIDDDIILMAEDGGYFDEFRYRPIAYRMIGKCWVNNHAHILKAKTGYEQGYLFYSLVHKDVVPFIASGTRAKLNKSELNRIEVVFPSERFEQTAIAAVLSDMDAAIEAFERRRAKTRDLKQAMMQELLTGKTRLVPPGGSDA